jgi:hypothetical protein
MTAELPIIQETIELFARAEAANLATSTRQGHVVHLPKIAGGDLMITTDLHGDRMNFERVVELADLSAHPQRHVVLQEICHGGPSYPGGMGCMSHLLLEDVAAYKLAYPEQVHFLLSNHELSEATDFPITKGGELQNVSFRMGLQIMYGEETDQVHAAIRSFLLSCPAALRFQETIFVSHTVPPRCDQRETSFEFLHRPWSFEDVEPGGDLFRFVWGRDFRRENAAAVADAVGATLMIHGHEPCPQGFQVPNDLQIILDSFGQHGRYILAPLDRPLTQADIVASLQKIQP